MNTESGFATAGVPERDVVDAWRGGPPSAVPLDVRVAEGYRRQRWPAVLGVVVAVVVVQVLNALLRHGRDRTQSRPEPLWLFGLGLLLFVSMFVVVGLVVVQRRRSGAPPPQQSPAWALTRTERTTAVGQVRGSVPFRSEQVPLLRLLADQQARQGPAVGVLLLLVAASIWVAVSLRQPVESGLLGVLAVLVTALSAHVGRGVVDARRFLRQYTAPT